MFSSLLPFLLTASMATTTLSFIESAGISKAETAETSKITQVIHKVFGKDAPLMIRVAECESSLRQTQDGKVLRGIVNSKDSGVFQINKDAHLEEAESLGLNVDKLEHNILYAKYLFDKYGTKPWQYSKKCWSK